MGTSSELGPKSQAMADSVERSCAHPFRERSKTELLEDLKTSMEQVLAGEFRPALEVLDELDREAMDDADTR